MGDTVSAEVVFKDIFKTIKGFNYTDYSDMAVFDVNTDNFLITYRLDKVTGVIRVTSDVTDYTDDRDYGIGKEMVGV